MYISVCSKINNFCYIHIYKKQIQIINYNFNIFELNQIDNLFLRARSYQHEMMRWILIIVIVKFIKTKLKLLLTFNNYLKNLLINKIKIFVYKIF